MLWEAEIRPAGRDAERDRVCDEFDLLTHGKRGSDLISAAARGFLFEGEFDDAGATMLARQLLVDPLVETVTVSPVGTIADGHSYTVLLKPGVMDPVSESVLAASRDIGIPLAQIHTFRRYFSTRELVASDRETLFHRVFANDAIERIITGTLQPEHFTRGKHYDFKITIVPLRNLDDAALLQRSKDGQLALSLDEMRTIQQHFRILDRDPTDVELETIAQTWSEHCSHKTLKGRIEYTETTPTGTTTRRYDNLLKETIFGATQTIRKNLGANDWCVSVFSDNAGIVTFDDQFHLCFKVETHNRPSAIEPYGGANTGLGGVIRDVLGTGLGGQPICNTDIFCFANPDFPPEQLPPGVIHPRRIMNGVVAGVRDYGNRMGIPTVNGAILFDDRYLANPLVFCGTVGLIPVGMEWKLVSPGERIIAVGGRTGRDGIHGATFSSEQLTDQSEKVSGGAVQMGNAIEEKKVLDVILQARDRRLYTAITDCGAGGFSSAVGEMGAECGARVELDKALLKYDGLSYTEIWISESQERIVLSVPPANWPDLQALCESEGVEAFDLGEFTDTGKLELTYHGQRVADVSIAFLHDGRPQVVRIAEWTAPNATGTTDTASSITVQDALTRILASYTVCSKEWVIRQYDHEVQGGSVIKPLVGVKNDGPSDAAVIMPVLGSHVGAAIGNGINPRYADIDPWAGAAAAIDEAMRNVVAVGADPTHTAILDNFCWGNVNDPQMLGALVRTAEACRDVALAYGTPFISGKDSLNNEYRSPTQRITIPHTLLISALGRVPDITKCVTMDLKAAGNDIYLIGETHDELGGSHYHLVTGREGGNAPRPNLELAPKIFAAMHLAISSGLVRSCHDLSEGGLAVAIAEMAFAGDVGVDVSGLSASDLSDEVRLFSESTTRFLIEVKLGDANALAAILGNLPFEKIGTTTIERRLRIAGASGEWIVWAKLSELKELWQKPLRW